MRVQPPRCERDAEDDARDPEGEPDGVPEGPREDVPRGLQRRGFHSPEKVYDVTYGLLCKHLILLLKTPQGFSFSVN